MDRIDEIYRERITAIWRAIYATRSIRDDNVPCKIEEGLYLGSLGAANNKSTLKSLNVTHILTVASSLPPAHPNDFMYKIIDIPDREDTNIAQYFDECFNFIDEAKGMGGGVLVHCFVGRSRSVTIVVAYLMKKHGMSMSEALAHVKSKRSIASPNSGFMLQLQSFEKSLQEQMSNVAKLEFAVLNFSGNNYLSWLLDAEIHLNAMGLGDTIVEGNNASSQDRSKAMIFLCHHIQEELENEYMTIRDPLELWINLKERYDHLKSVSLSKAQYDLIHLRFQDYKSVNDYNSAMFRIVSRLKLCGEVISEESMIEKTLSTFHATHLLLQQMYRLQNFKKYSELMTCLLVAEQNNELLLQNHNARPTDSAPFPEANGISFQRQEHSCGRDRGRSGRYHGRSSYQSYGNTIRVHQKLDKLKQKRRGGQNKIHKPPKDYVDVCFRCGSKGHWARNCRTPKHLVELYQISTGQVSREK